uniref:Uncharacterized protein n=1 Tax=Solanum tuberosum TaxID=4113 RepID=M1D8W5_SOLTU
MNLKSKLFDRILCDVPFFVGFDDGIQIPSRPFTRNQARDLQKMQGLFMKLEVLEMVLMENKGYALKIAWGSTDPFGEPGPVGGLPKGLGDDPSPPKVTEYG